MEHPKSSKENFAWGLAIGAMIFMGVKLILNCIFPLAPAGQPIKLEVGAYEVVALVPSEEAAILKKDGKTRYFKLPPSCFEKHVPGKTQVNYDFKQDGSHLIYLCTWY